VIPGESKGLLGKEQKLSIGEVKVRKQIPQLILKKSFSRKAGRVKKE